MAIKQNQSNIIESQKYSDFIAIKYLPVWISMGVLWLITRLPYSWLMALGRSVGKLAFYSMKSRRKVCQTNIDLCFPEKTEKEREVLVWDTFVSYGQGLVETAYSWFGDIEKLSDRIFYKGFEHLERAREQGENILLVGGHFAILDLAGGLLARKVDFHVVQRNHDNPLFNLFMTRARKKAAQSCVARKDIRSMIKIIKRGEILWYAPDQDYGKKNSVFVPFFNIQTATITGTSRLAKLSNATVIPILYSRDDENNYHVELFAPLPMPSGDDESDAISVNSWLEAQARKHPEQYLWLHKRFKSRPNGEKSFY